MYFTTGSEELRKTLTTHHTTPAALQALHPARMFSEWDGKAVSMHWIHYDRVQTEVLFLGKRQAYSPKLTPVSRLFNSYFRN